MGFRTPTRHGRDWWPILTHPVGYAIAGLTAAFLMAACVSLPREAEQAALRTFEPEEQPAIQSARRVEPLAEDQGLGAEEVWCVTVRYRCWSCPHGEWYTCFSSRLVRRIDGAWQVDLMMTDEDWENWEARGCPREPDIIGMAPF